MESDKQNATYDAFYQMLPAGPGSYVLVLRLAAACHLTIGRTLEAELSPGYYLYVGSALRGLRGRLKRYLTWSDRAHWHIDYLVRKARPSEIWYRQSAERLECVWATRLMQSSSVTPAVPRFGSSDCRCSTHLYYTVGRPSPNILGDPAVRVLRIAPE